MLGGVLWDQVHRIVQRLFEDSGMTYDQLAANTGLGRMHAWRIVNGKVKPEVDTLRKLLDGLGSSLAELFDELSGGVTDLSKQQGKKDLSPTVAKADNTGSTNGHQVSAPDFSFLEGTIAGATEELVAAIDRLNTTLHTLLERVDAGVRQAPEANAAQAGGSARAAGGAGKSRRHA